MLEKLNVLPGNIVLRRDVRCGGRPSLFALEDTHPSLAIGMDFDLGHLEIARSFGGRTRR